MIISDQHRFLFLQTPRTGSTAIATELVQHYAADAICSKHGNYYTFRRRANLPQTEYFVFAGVRDPIESVYSKFNKYLSDHRGKYSRLARPGRRRSFSQGRALRIFDFVQESRSFGDYLLRYYRLPFVNHLAIHKHRCDAILRFENLEQDFEQVLSGLGVDVQKPLPLINKTEKLGRSPLAGLNARERKHCAFVFGPFMEEWGYAMPAELEGESISRGARVLYAIEKNLLRAVAKIAAWVGLDYPS